MDRRIADGRTRGRKIEILVDGHAETAFAGESVAAALLAAGRRVLRASPRTGAPRGVWCGIGQCFECVVRIDDRPGVRACQTPVRAGMRVDTRPQTASGGSES